MQCIDGEAGTHLAKPMPRKVNKRGNFVASATSGSNELYHQTVQRIEECLLDGFKPPTINGIGAGGAIAEASRRAVEDGLCNTERTFERRYELAKAAGVLPDWSKWRAPVYQRPEFSSALLAQNPIGLANKPSGKPVRVCVIGDAHDDPRFEDKSRFQWIGRWCAEEAPDYIVQLGDWATFDSMSRHAERGSLQQRMQPSFLQDIESLAESISAFESGYSGKAKKIFTAGNHEDRVGRYENSNPDMCGTLVPQWRNLFQSEGWHIHEYGEYAFIEGVGFIHHPVNGIGRAYGGKTGNQRVGNDTIFSIVHGHDHRLERVSSSKIGPFQPVEIISAGCSLPWGWVEPYAKLSPAGWWWGVLSLTIHSGLITDMNAISMLSLERKYGGRTQTQPAIAAPQPSAVRKRSSRSRVVSARTRSARSETKQRRSRPK